MNATIHPTETASLAETSLHCPLCGEPLAPRAQECTKCDWIPGYQEHEHARDHYDRRDIAAAAVSFVPGAGHILKGHMPAGILMLALIPVVIVFAFAFTMFFGWLLIPVYWIGVAMDTYFRPDLRGLAGMRPEADHGEPMVGHH